MLNRTLIIFSIPGRKLESCLRWHISPYLLDKVTLTVYNSSLLAGLAQLFRARPCQGRGRELESLNPHQLMNVPKGRFLVVIGVKYL